MSNHASGLCGTPVRGPRLERRQECIRKRVFDRRHVTRPRREKGDEAVVGISRRPLYRAMCVADRTSLDGREIWSHFDHLARISGRPSKSGVEFRHVPMDRRASLLQAINVEEATVLLAARYAPERYQEFRVE